MTEPIVEVRQTREGGPYEHHASRGFARSRVVQIDREWEVLVDGEVAGKVLYRLFTRERRSKGKRYVNARWRSPGWGIIETGTSYCQEVRSRKEGVELLVHNHSRKRAD